MLYGSPSADLKFAHIVLHSLVHSRMRGCGPPYPVARPKRWENGAPVVTNDLSMEVATLW